MRIDNDKEIKLNFREETFCFPVVWKGYSLFFDEQENCVLAQLEFESAAQDVLNAIYLDVACLDEHGRPIAQVKRHAYLGLHAKTGGQFGDSAPFLLPNGATRRLQIRLRSAVMGDGNTWEASSLEWFGAAGFAASPGEEESYSDQNVGQSGPATEMQEQMPANKRTEELERAILSESAGHKESAPTKKRLPRRKKAFLAGGACVVLLLLAVLAGIPYYYNQVLPERAYQKARMELQSGRYSEALRLFTEMGAYKDSAQWLEETQKEIQYEQARQQLDAGAFEESYGGFVRLGDFRDARDQANQAMYCYIINLMEKDEWQEAYNMAKKFKKEPMFQELIEQCEEANAVVMKTILTNRPCKEDGTDYTIEDFTTEQRIDVQAEQEEIANIYQYDTLYLFCKIEGGLGIQTKRFRVSVTWPNGHTLETEIVYNTLDSDKVYLAILGAQNIEPVPGSAMIVIQDQDGKIIHGYVVNMVERSGFGVAS